jgi:UDP-glucose 4-epimerase
MKILITGALGHIGSRLIRELPSISSDLEIIMMDNFATQRYCSLFNLPSSGHYRFIEGDVLTYDLDSLLEGVNIVVHLAAVTDATASFELKDKVELVNFNATEIIAEACAKHGSALIFLSTTSVYGTQEDIVDENCSAEELKPQSPYAEAKLKSEQLLHNIGISKGLRFITLRFGTIFGVSPGMRFHTAVNKFVWQACVGKPITVWRTAYDQKRPYLDLTDAVQSLNFIINKNVFNNQIYNVLTVNATVGEIVKIIKSNIKDLQIEYVDTRIMNQLSYNVLNNKFRSLGFEFKGSLEAGIKQSIELLRNIRKNLNS